MLSSILLNMLPSTLTRDKTLPKSLDCMLLMMLLGARSRDLQSCRQLELGGKWQEVEGGGHVTAAGIMTSVNIITQTLFKVRPP